MRHKMNERKERKKMNFSLFYQKNIFTFAQIINY
jgi:hypothetical protein